MQTQYFSGVATSTVSESVDSIDEDDEFAEGLLKKPGNFSRERDKIFMSLKTALAGLFLTLSTLASSAQTTNQITINAAGTFLKTCPNSTAPNASVVNLAALGIVAGDYIQLTSLGDFSHSAPDVSESGAGMTAVFSSTNLLTDRTNQFRVPGAIDAGTDVPMYGSGCDPIEIPEDFSVPTSGVGQRVPSGAAYLFVQARDHSTADNSDPNGDFKLRIINLGQITSRVNVSQVQICWPSLPDVIYDVKYRSDLTTNLWTPLQSGILGNGSTNCVSDGVSSEKRFYKVVFQGE